jgi:hypothetical protein
MLRRTLMKTILFTLLLFVFGLLLSAIPLSAADVSGKWSGTLEFKSDAGETKSGPALLILKQEGNKVTGSGGPNESEQHPIENGKIEGNRLRFEATGGHGPMYFDLKVDGDQISGEIKRGKESTTDTAKISLKRVVEK